MELWSLFSFLAVLFFSLQSLQTTSAEHPMSASLQNGSREHQVARELFGLEFFDMAMHFRQFREDQIVSLLKGVAKGQDPNEAYQNSFKNAFYKGVRREIKDEACKYLVPDDSGSCANKVVCELSISFLAANLSCGNDQPDCNYTLPDTNRLIKSACGVCKNMCYEYKPDNTCAQWIQGKLVEASEAAPPPVEAIDADSTPVGVTGAASSSTSFLRLPIIFALASTSFAIASLC